MTTSFGGSLINRSNHKFLAASLNLIDVEFNMQGGNSVIPVSSENQFLITELYPSGVLRFIFNNVSRSNALSEKMLYLLHDAVDSASTNPGVRVVIISGKGPVFCSGHDLKELTAARSENDGGRKYFVKILHQCSSLMQKIVNCPKPVIAEVGGLATAAGCQLVASCDLAIAADTAYFCTPGVNIGLFCSTPMVALSRNLASKHAMEMLLTGDKVPAKWAEEKGLINKVVAEADLSVHTMELASKIASKSTRTLTLGKRAFYKQKEMDLVSAYAYASEVMVTNMFARDAEEGVAAFFEKRLPEWRDE